MGGEFAAYGLLHVLLRDFYLLRKVEDFKDVLILLKAYGAQQRRHGQLLLTVDISIHHVVDVRGELYPRTLERYDAGTVKHRAVGMHALTEEHAGRTVQLRYHHALRAIDDERAVARHVRYGAEEHVGDYRLEVRVVLIGAVQLHLGLHRHTVREAALKALLYGIAWRVDEIVKELKDEMVTRVCNGEVLGEHLVQAIILALLRRCVQLEEITERLQLHVKEIRIRHRILHVCEANSVFNNFGCHASLYKYDDLYLFLSNPRYSSNPRLCGPSCPRPAAFLDWQQPSRRFGSVIDTIRLGPAYLVDPNRDFLFLLT